MLPNDVDGMTNSVDFIANWVYLKNPKNLDIWEPNILKLEQYRFTTE